MNTIYCPSCGAQTNKELQFCQKCGHKLQGKEPLEYTQINQHLSPKSGKIALIFCILFGLLGIHRFYVGKIGTGILTLITGGFLGLWNIIDLILLIKNKFKDKEGRIVLVTKGSSGLKTPLLIIGSIIAWIVIALGFLLILASYLTSGLVNTANDQLDALKHGDLEKAYSYTASEYQSAVPFKDFQLWVNSFPELKNNLKAEFTERGINNYSGFLNAGFIKGTLTATDGKKLEVQYLFIKEHETWKILGIIPNRN